MWWLAAIGAAKAASSLLASQAQASQQEREADEQLRRMKAQHAETLGQGGAIEGASGLVVGASSLSQHLANMAAEFARQENWALQAGTAQAEATRTAGWWNAATDFGSSMINLGKAANWGQKPALAPAGGGYDPLSSLAGRRA